MEGEFSAKNSLSGLSKAERKIHPSEKQLKKAGLSKTLRVFGVV